MSEIKLTVKQRLFCKFYLLNGFNGTQAAISAGYSRESSREIASENMTKPAVKKYIDKYMGSMEKKLDVTVEWKMDSLKRVVNECFDGRGQEISPSNIIGAIAELNKMQGHYAKEDKKKDLEPDDEEKATKLIEESKKDF